MSFWILGNNGAADISQRVRKRSLELDAVLEHRIHHVYVAVAWEGECRAMGEKGKLSFEREEMPMCVQANASLTSLASLCFT